MRMEANYGKFDMRKINAYLDRQSPTRPAPRRSGRKPKPRKKMDVYSPSGDEGKKLLRRERNKEAAAKCRKKRVEQLGQLHSRKMQLAEEKEALEYELNLLREMIDQVQGQLIEHSISGQCLDIPQPQLDMPQPQPTMTPYINMYKEQENFFDFPEDFLIN